MNGGLRPRRLGRLADAVPHCLRQLRAQEPHPDDEPGVLEIGQRLVNPDGYLLLAADKYPY